jgi:hypothetical protein
MIPFAVWKPPRIIDDTSDLGLVPLGEVLCTVFRIIVFVIFGALVEMSENEIPDSKPVDTRLVCMKDSDK